MLNCASEIILFVHRNLHLSLKFCQKQGFLERLVGILINLRNFGSYNICSYITVTTIPPSLVPSSRGPQGVHMNKRECFY